MKKTIKRLAVTMLAGSMMIGGNVSQFNAMEIGNYSTEQTLMEAVYMGKEEALAIFQTFTMSRQFGAGTRLARVNPNLGTNLHVRNSPGLPIDGFNSVIIGHLAPGSHLVLAGTPSHTGGWMRTLSPIPGYIQTGHVEVLAGPTSGSIN